MFLRDFEVKNKFKKGHPFVEDLLFHEVLREFNVNAVVNCF